MKRSWLVKILGLAVMSSLVGCAPTVKREVGQLNLTYTASAVKSAKKDKVIALVSPEVLKKQNSAEANSQGNLNNPFLAAMMQQGRVGAVNMDFNGLYSKSYSRQVKVAFDNALQAMMSNKGFNLTGPYGTFDDMAYNDKKKAYLALAPVLNLEIDNKITNSDSSSLTNIDTVEGVISVGGELLVNFIEPMTKERIMSKRINLSDLNIQKGYVRQEKTRAGNMLVDAIASRKELTDNTDKALTDAINEFYAKAMLKIDNMISDEEIVSYDKTVSELKGLKRF